MKCTWNKRTFINDISMTRLWVQATGDRLLIASVAFTNRYVVTYILKLGGIIDPCTLHTAVQVTSDIDVYTAVVGSLLAHEFKQ